MSTDLGNWLAAGRVLLLALSAGIALTALLRKPGRRWFGAGLAYRLWSLPPLAMLAGMLPHVATAPVVLLLPVLQAMSLQPPHLHAPVGHSGGFDWRVVTMLIWSCGSLVSVLLAVMAQSRYRRCLRDATAVRMKDSAYPVLRARAADVGPAMVGAWHRRIVIPCDFEQRYSSGEQALILAHEVIHARRFDGMWCLVGRLMAALFWFYLPAWWALAAFRQDQELACDAAVLHEHGGQRRLYADAMLKTRPAGGALPVGCAWAPRHPLMERIAMLKAKPPGASRRRFGWMVLVAVATGLTAAVYAAVPATQARTLADPGDRYTLKADVSMGGSIETLHFMQCVKRGEPVDFAGTNAPALSWKGRFAISPVANGQLEIRAHIDTRFDRDGGSVREESGEPVVRTLPGQAATVVFGQVVKDARDLKLQDNTIKLVLTPSPGCAAASMPIALPGTTTDRTGAREYQLNTSVEFTRNNGRSDSSKRATFAICTTSGKQASLKMHDLLFDVTPVKDRGDHLHIDLKASDATHALVAHAVLEGMVDSILHADGASADGNSRYVMEITPLRGCPARESAVVRQAKV